MINDYSVVVKGGILAGKENPASSIIGGIGGKVLKSDVNWCAERIPVENPI